jgi:hypothetical protein
MFLGANNVEKLLTTGINIYGDITGVLLTANNATQLKL